MKEGNVLFNDALNTFLFTVIWRRTYGKGPLMESGNPHRLLFPDNSKGYFICTDRITHTTAFVTPVVENWLEREIAQWVYHEGSIRRHIAP